MNTDRLNEFKKASGLTNAKIAEITGITQSNIDKITSGNNTNPKLETIQAICRAIGCTLDDIDDTLPNNQNETLFEKYDNIKPIALKKFPLLGKIACGKPIFAEEDRESFIMADMDINADFCLIAKGDSMINARILDGDIVFIKEMPIVDNGEIAAVIIDDEATLKRVYYYPEKNKLILQAENPAYEPLVYMNEELEYIRILGKAVYFTSKI